MKVVSWNINGIRAIMKKGFAEWLDRSGADVVCLQEIKADFDSIPAEIRQPPGYHAFWHPCERKKGYSGVGILSRIMPDTVESKIGIQEFDEEGRILELSFGSLIIYGVYFPNGSTGNARVPYKMRFYDALFRRCSAQRSEGKKIVVAGDYNTAHHEIDLARPKENQHTTGFLPEERLKLDELVDDNWLDTFRVFHPEQANVYTYWDYFTKARERNVGWRIDYHWITADLEPALKNAWIESDVMGSDHCPVGIYITP